MYSSLRALLPGILHLQILAGNTVTVGAFTVVTVTNYYLAAGGTLTNVTSRGPDPENAPEQTLQTSLLSASDLISGITPQQRLRQRGH